MADVQNEIESLSSEIAKAKEAIDKAIRERRGINKDSPLWAECNTAIAAAKDALVVVELKIRRLYESKGDE
jgi:hypothetical protein